MTENRHCHFNNGQFDSLPDLQVVPGDSFLMRDEGIIRADAFHVSGDPSNIRFDNYSSQALLQAFVFVVYRKISHMLIGIVPRLMQAQITTNTFPFRGFLQPIRVSQALHQNCIPSWYVIGDVKFYCWLAPVSTVQE